MHKDAYESASIEKSTSAVPMAASDISSYVAPENGRWCTTVNTADTVADLNPANTQRLFTAADLGLEGVKDRGFLRRTATTPCSSAWLSIPPPPAIAL